MYLVQDCYSFVFAHIPFPFFTYRAIVTDMSYLPTTKASDLTDVHGAGTCSVPIGPLPCRRRTHQGNSTLHSPPESSLSPTVEAEQVSEVEKSEKAVLFCSVCVIGFRHCDCHPGLCSRSPMPALRLGSLMLDGKRKERKSRSKR